MSIIEKWKTKTKLWSNGDIKEENVILEKRPARNTANELDLQKKGANQYKTIDSAKN